MGKNLNENWHISTILRESVLFFSIIPGLLDAYLYFGKEQYMCWGGRTAVQADLYM